MPRIRSFLQIVFLKGAFGFFSRFAVNTQSFCNLFLGSTSSFGCASMDEIQFGFVEYCDFNLRLKSGLLVSSARVLLCSCIQRRSARSLTRPCPARSSSLGGARCAVLVPAARGTGAGKPAATAAACSARRRLRQALAQPATHKRGEREETDMWGPLKPTNGVSVAIQPVFQFPQPNM